MGAPITHAAGAMAVMLAAQGATVVMRPGFDAEDSLDQIERHDVTHLFIPPTAYYRMLESQRDRKSVVQGKSVSVRVDLGGRRLIKKKKYSDETVRDTQAQRKT